jgi:hypothetical protein
MEKIIFERKDKCPYCSGLIHTKVSRVTIEKSVPGVSEIRGVLEKDPQSTLDKDYQKSLKPKKKQVERKKW